MKSRIITITGNLGAGKSTAGKTVASLLSYTHKSTGDFMRSMAEERGLTLSELSKNAESDPSIDNAIDSNSIYLRDKSDIVLDSRLAWHFIPESFKVFLKIDPIIAAERILNDKKVNAARLNEDTNSFDSVETIADSINARIESEKKRYFDLYKIENHLSPENYDLVIDTGLPENSIEHVPEIIVAEYQKWLQK